MAGLPCCGYGVAPKPSKKKDEIFNVRNIWAIYLLDQFPPVGFFPSNGGEK